MSHNQQTNFLTESASRVYKMQNQQATKATDSFWSLLLSSSIGIPFHCKHYLANIVYQTRLVFWADKCDLMILCEIIFLVGSRKAFKWAYRESKNKTPPCILILLFFWLEFQVNCSGTWENTWDIWYPEHINYEISLLSVMILSTDEFYGPFLLLKTAHRPSSCSTNGRHFW